MEKACEFCQWVEELKTENKDAKKQCEEIGNKFFEKYELHLFAQLHTKLLEKDSQLYVNDTCHKLIKLKYCPSCGKKFED